MNAQTVSIASSAISNTICAGTPVTFTATPSGYTSPSYQWYKNNVAISGETSSTYSSTSLLNNDLIYVAAKELSPSAASIVTNGLIVQLDASDPASYTSGTTWTDLKGNASGAINGAVNYVSNSTASYFSFPGTDNAYIRSSASKAIQDFTIVFQPDFSHNNYNGGHTLFAKVNSTPYEKSMRFWSDNFSGLTNLNARVWGAPNSNSNTSDWAGTNSLFLNGVNQTSTYFALVHGWNILGGTNNTTASWGTFSYQLGAAHASSGAGRAFLGKMAVVLMYDRTLTSAEQLQNFNALRSRFELASNAIIINLYPSPSTPTLTVSGDACINKTTLSTTSGLSSYTWTKDNITIPGATSNTLSPTLAGDYKVAVSNGTCSNTSTTTTIYTCGVTTDGKMRPTSSVTTLLSNEGGINFGTGTNETGSIFNTTGLTTITGTIGSTTAILGGVIRATNALTSSIGIIYSADINFGTYSTTAIQSNVVAGTYTMTISGLSYSTPYYSKSFIVNKSGTNYGAAVSFTTTTRPIAVGDSYGGGIVIYIAGPSDPGYDANTTHGLIAAKVDLGSMNWNNGSIAGTSNNYFGAGIGNTSIIIAQSGSNGGTNYAAKACDDYTVTETVGGVTTTYSDWYLGSTFEIQKMMSPNPASSYLTGLLNGYYWASNEQTASGPSPGAGAVLGSALYVTKANGGLDQWNKTGGSGIMGVRAIRKF
jgi:hypothetical protein